MQGEMHIHLLIHAASQQLPVQSNFMQYDNSPYDSRMSRCYVKAVKYHEYQTVGTLIDARTELSQILNDHRLKVRVPQTIYIRLDLHNSHLL
jgi:hypothetical protein